MALRTAKIRFCRIGVCLALFQLTLPWACHPRKTSRLMDQAESREEAYVKAESLANLPAGQVFQLRLRTNSEQCAVPYWEQLNPRQCDGKSHWRLLKKSSTDSSLVRIQHTVAPVCIAADNDRIRFDLASDGSCEESRFDVRFDGYIRDASGKELIYLPSPTNPQRQQELEIWIPVSIPDADQFITTWNLDLNYGPAFLHPSHIQDRMIYQTDGWSYGNRRWLSAIFIYSDLEQKYLKGLKTVYSDGENITANTLGACDGSIVEASCKLLDTVFLGDPPVGRLTPEELANQHAFLTSVSILYNKDYMIGVKFAGNKLPSKTILAPQADTLAVVETPIKFAHERSDQVITGFYGSSGQLNASQTSGYLKDLGVIGGRYQTYARAWQEETVVGPTGQSFLTRRSEKAFDAFGPTSVPANGEQGYFETIAPLDTANRHWISSIELFSGGGRNEMIRSGLANMAFYETNDVIGMKVKYSLTDESGAQGAHELLIGFSRATKTPNPVIDFGAYEYLSKLEYRALLPEYSETLPGGISSHAYTFTPTPGIAALRFTLSNIRDASERIIVWDPSIQDRQNPASARTTSPSKSTRFPYTDWIDLGSDPERAIVGFYGVSNNVQNPTYQSNRVFIPAIQTFGLITTTVGCAFRFKVFKQEDIDKIRELGKVHFDSFADGARPSCIPPQEKHTAKL